MPLSFTPISNNPHWAGYVWSVDDEEQLAQLVARVALGQYRYVLRVLAGTGCLPYAPAATALEGAKKLLAAQNTSEPWHRDGWLFQVLSWIAAHLQGGATLVAPPHMIHAHKGFDGLQVLLDKNTKQVISVVICEEKATNNPRKMITDKVWEDFKSLHSGTRDNELAAQLVSLLEQRADIDADAAVQNVLWKDTRAYRVAITVGDGHSDELGRKKLFKGYKSIVPGPVSRRRAETLYLDNLREWMKQIAAKATKAAEEIEAKNV
jgi:hypothetical protein